MGEELAIQVKDVTKSFRQVRLKGNYSTLKSSLLHSFSRQTKKSAALEILKGVNLSAAPGETIGLIGRNGSGKSTLLKIMAGIYKPTSGQVIMNGRVSSLIELGAGFHPEFSGRENIFLNGVILGLTKEEISKRFDSIVRFAELEEFIDSPVRTYSSGMYVRLGFSVAVNVNPDILLIDEILAVGDEAFVHKCEDKIHEFKRAGKTIILVSHDLNAVEKFCHRAVWLEEGVVQTEDEPIKVADTYRQFVARLEDETARRELAAGQATGDRWGDGRVELVEVSILDGAGQPRGVFQPGEAMTVRIDYRIVDPVKELVFGVSLVKADGSHVFGTNTEIDRLNLDDWPPSGRVECRFSGQELVNGTYFVDAAAHAKDGRAYDYWTRCRSFAVRSNIGDAGVYRLPHTWKLP